MSLSWLFLALSVAAYGFGNFLQAVAAANQRKNLKLSPKLLLQMATHRSYLVGLTCQLLGFAFAFLARADLPLFLVQASASGALGLTALLGVLVLKWRLPAIELILLGTLTFGILALILSAEQSPSEPLGVIEVVLLAVVAVAIAILGRYASRRRGTEGSVALGGLAGLGFGAAAIASRPLAGADSIGDFLTNPLLYIMVVNSITAQLLLAASMQRGSTNAAVASMDVGNSVPPAIFGLVLLGDRIAPDREWLALVGFVLAIGSVLLLTKYASDQHAGAPGDYPVPVRSRDRRRPRDRRVL